MKKTIFFTLCLSAFVTFSASAKIWRVNNNPGISADFTTLQAAHDGATANDTLHIESSSVSYGDIVFYKKLVILGAGYFLTENLNNQASILGSTLGTVTFSTGSSGSIISGLSITGIQVVDASQILINSNKIVGIQINDSSSCSHIWIISNYIDGSVTTHNLNSLQPIISDIEIGYNYINQGISLTYGFSGSIYNNVIYYNYIYTTDFVIKNNIFYDGTAGINPGDISHPNLINNNIFSNPGLTNGSNNLTGVLMTDVFQGPTGNTTDGQWRLKAGSPAIGAGLNAENCGMFNGIYNYRLSGIPFNPSVYVLNAPATSSGNTLPITISVKSNNH